MRIPHGLRAAAGAKAGYSGDIAVAAGSSSYIYVYPFNSGTGFGTKYSDPSTLPNGSGNGIAFSPNRNVVVVANNANPCINAYPWTSGTGFGTRYSDPATLPSGNVINPPNGYGVAFSPSGNDLVLAANKSPYIWAYPWSSGFGTQYSDPSTVVSGVGNSVAFTPSGTRVALAHRGSPYVTYIS